MHVKSSVTTQIYGRNKKLRHKHQHDKRSSFKVIELQQNLDFPQLILIEQLHTRKILDSRIVSWFKPTASRCCPLWTFTLGLPLKVSKTRLLGRDFHTLVRLLCIVVSLIVRPVTTQAHRKTNIALFELSLSGFPSRFLKRVY